MPFDARVNVVTQDYSYDQESWNLRIAVESTYSTSANRIGSDDFTLELRDICWDVPTVAPTTTETEYTVYLWDDSSDPISEVMELDTNMDLGTGWDADSDYCGGFTYTIALVTADSNAPIVTREDSDGNYPTDAELEARLNELFTATVATDGTVTFEGYVTEGYTSSEDATQWVDATTGIGTWIINIQGTVGNVDDNSGTWDTTRGDSGVFTTNTAVTADFTLQINNPCISSQVDDISLLPDDYGSDVPTLEARI